MPHQRARRAGDALPAPNLALLAGFFPAIYEALDMDMRVREIGTSATEFTNIRDRFRQMAAIHAHSSFDEFKAPFEQLMDRMDAARSAAPPLPEWCFKEAQKKSTVETTISTSTRHEREREQLQT